MNLGAFFVGLALAATACGGEASSEHPPGDGQPDESTSAAHQCTLPSAGDVNAGACSIGRALVSCSSPNGGCTCLSDDPKTCAGCSEQLGADVECENKCAPNEYAVSCGGPPKLDGGTYQSVPKDCTALSATPGGNTYACCPCR